MPGKWNREWDARLGRLPDSELADEVGVSRQTVIAKRRALGIPAYEHRPHEFSPADDEAVRSMRKGDAARAIGCSRRDVETRRKELGVVYKARGRTRTPRPPHVFDAAQDAIIAVCRSEDAARAIGCRRSEVVRRRKELGLKQVRVPGRTRSAARVREDLARHGGSVRLLAAEYGVSPQRIYQILTPSRGAD